MRLRWDATCVWLSECQRRWRWWLSLPCKRRRHWDLVWLDLLVAMLCSRGCDPGCYTILAVFTDRFTCAGPDLPLQERHQAGTLEIPIPLYGNEVFESYDFTFGYTILSFRAYELLIRLNTIQVDVTTIYE